MGGVKIVGVVLIVLGILGLVIGHFEYTRKRTKGSLVRSGSRLPKRTPP